MSNSLVSMLIKIINQEKDNLMERDVLHNYYRDEIIKLAKDLAELERVELKNTYFPNEPPHGPPRPQKKGILAQQGDESAPHTFASLRRGVRWE